jgi:hypothetical protein
MKKTIILLSVFTFLLSCHNQKNVQQNEPQQNIEIQNNGIINNDDNKQIEQENITARQLALINEDKQMREQYASEIALANMIMVELDNYYLLNNTYPLPSEGFIITLEEQITEEAGMVFDYVWLIDDYVLCYILPDRTGLLYESRYKLWGITVSIP